MSFLPVAAVQEMLADRLQERRATDQGRAPETVRAAIQQRYITPGMREWALALCQSDEASFAAYRGNVGPVFAHLSKSASAPALIPNRPATLGTDLETSICEQLGLKPGKLRT